MLRRLSTRRADAAANMALDAFLLGHVPPGEAVFRAYGWTEPAATFGYAQPWEAVRPLFPPEMTLCRRPTGGGIVDHRSDWTYCLVLGAEVPAARRAAPAFYCFLHETLGACLRELGVETRLAPCPGAASVTEKRSGPTRCFAAPAPSDLIRPDGRKVAGAALRRNRHGLLVQGSLDCASLVRGFDFEALEKRLPAAFASGLGFECAASGDNEAGIEPARLEAERARFASEAWNRRR